MGGTSPIRYDVARNKGSSSSIRYVESSKQAEHNGELDPVVCGSTAVSHIIFVNDLMVFLKADKKNARCLKKILDDFSARSELNINFLKSAIYFEGTVKDRRWIESQLCLSTGELPVRYLGLLLLSKRLSAKDCAPLIQASDCNLRRQSSSPMLVGRSSSDRFSPRYTSTGWRCSHFWQACSRRSIEPCFTSCGTCTP